MYCQYRLRKPCGSATLSTRRAIAGGTDVEHTVHSLVIRSISSSPLRMRGLPFRIRSGMQIMLPLAVLLCSYNDH
jgi:hypothetical protein